MLHLYNNQVGYDRTALGFPSVMGCNAIVYQTPQAIFGLHNYGGTEKSSLVPRADAFRRYVQSTNIAHEGTGKHLYSVIHGEHRYYDKDKYNAEWEDELKAIAQALKHRGPIHLVRVVKHISASTVKDGLYIQFNINKVLGGCSISYKRWSKMQDVKTEKKPVSGNLQELAKRQDTYEVAEPTEMVGWVGFGTGTGLHSTNFGNAKTRTIRLP